MRNCWLHSSLSLCWIQMNEWDSHLLCRSTVPLWRLLLRSHHASNTRHWRNRPKSRKKKQSAWRQTWSNLQLAVKPCVAAIHLKRNSCRVDVAEARGMCFQQFVGVEDQAHLAPQRAPPPTTTTLPPPTTTSHHGPQPGNQVRPASVWNTGVGVVIRANAKSGAAESVCRRVQVLQQKMGGFREEQRSMNTGRKTQRWQFLGWIHLRLNIRGQAWCAKSIFNTSQK